MLVPQLTELLILKVLSRGLLYKRLTIYNTLITFLKRELIALIVKKNL